MTGDQPQQPARRRLFFKGLDVAKLETIEAEMEQREQLRRTRASAGAVPAAVPESQPADSGATDWGAVAEGLRHLAEQLRRAAGESGPSPG